MFHKTLTILSLVGLLFGVALLAGPYLLPTASIGPDTFATLAKKFGIRVMHEDIAFPVKIYHGTIAGREAGESDVAAYAPILTSEFDLYPVDYVKNSKLRRIILCRNLSFNGQPRGAIPDFENHALYLDVRTGKHAELWQRKAVHHEFFHIVDYEDDGKIYEDEDWKKLNPESFEYGDGGIKMRDPDASLLTTSIPGFLTAFSTSGVEEDKAEIFANMMVDLAVVEKRANADAVIRSKMLFMRKLIRSFSADCDDDFWSKIRKRSASPP